MWLILAAALSGVEFNRDVRPIFSDACYKCHGPDAAKRKAGLRLDLEEGALADLGGRRAVVPGDPGQSELIRRITAEDEAERMPPASTGRKLTADEVDRLRRWIAEGARWQRHWSLSPPSRPVPPAARNAGWARSPADAFVLTRLEAEGLEPSPEADPITLLRRAAFDLTGLPPSLSDVDSCLEDASPDAHERALDRLLASPRFGERMAARWLDAARYADTNGYQSDGERFMWRWRDWVIDAFNRNLPFDRFTVEQLAGDLLPDATLEQKVATGFNRNHRGNGEGGVIAEEYAIEYVADRVETTTTVWLGLTMGCARCHDHKYDPILQEDFYRVFAFFNNIPENGKAIKFGNSPPVIPAPTPRQAEELARLERSLAEAEERLAALEPVIAEAQAAWERSLALGPAVDWWPAAGLKGHLDFNDIAAGVPAGSAPLRDRLRRVEELNAALSRAIRSGDLGAYKVLDGELTFASGPMGQAAAFDGSRFLDAGEGAAFGFLSKFTLAAWVRFETGGGGTAISRMLDVPQGAGYSLTIAREKLQLNLVQRWLDDALRVETERGLEPGAWHHVAASYDGSRVARGIRLYVDGRPERIRVLLDELNQSFEAKEQRLRIGAGGGRQARFRGLIDDVRIHDRVLAAEEVEMLASADSVSAAASAPPGRRTRAQAFKLRACFLEEHGPEPFRRARADVDERRRSRDAAVESYPTTMVMEEMPIPRETFVLTRGEYDKRGKRVDPGVPASLAAWPSGEPPNRLGFARWIASPANPLTARVAANRLWQMLFGAGIVRTTEDFGSQGDLPSHPELLDWLATELVRAGWDVKALLRTVIASATYRQSSKAAPAILERDPENRLLTRGPRFRLSAEAVRDLALASSGLLVETLGGPSVKPYQPPGLWKDLGAADYAQDKGEKLYRRSLYTFWKRTAAPPVMAAFDAAGREACCVRDTRTNTPLQALALMNETTFVECARALAQRAMKDAGPAPADRLGLAYRRVLARPPRPAEMEILLAGLERHLEDFRADPGAALELISIGEQPRDESLDPGEHAAYTAMASVILNLDEAITKE